MYRRRSHNLESSSKSLESLRLKVDRNISYRKLATSQNHEQKRTSDNFQKLSDVKSHGPPPASPSPMPAPHKAATVSPDTLVVPIGNLPPAEDLGPEIPDKYQHELYRLRQRVEELKAAILERDERLLTALAMLESERQFWHTGLHAHIWETLGQIMRRVTKLNATIDALKSVQTKFHPLQEMPERWKRG